MFFILIAILLIFPFFVCTAWAMGSAMIRIFPTSRQRYLWIFIAAIPFIGAPIYFIFGKRRGLPRPVSE
jgi:hypothetical protein